MDKPDSDHTNGYVTETSLGPIPHKSWNGLLCPVKLRVIPAPREDNPDGLVTEKGTRAMPVPKRDSWGRFLYALPGGGEAAL